MNWQTWMEQHLPFTEIKRGGATVWPKGGNGLIGDSLGPVLHSHDNASEIFYFLAGRCRLEIGDTEEFFEAGDFILVPPDVPHNLWNAGEDELLVFWLVAPNFIQNKWRTENFVPGAMKRRGVRARVENGADLPSDKNIRTQFIHLTSNVQQRTKEPQFAARQHGGSVLSKGQVSELLRLQSRTGDAQEAVIYIVEGDAQVQVGKLGGVLHPNEFVNVQTGTDYSVAPVGEAARVLVFEMPGAG